ncbi:uncharacterized protein LOC144103264 [Amblyomma americanum]
MASTERAESPPECRSRELVLFPSERWSHQLRAAANLTADGRDLYHPEQFDARCMFYPDESDERYCFVNKTIWYFDSDDSVCYSHKYQGCRSFPELFATEEDCKNACVC